MDNYGDCNMCLFPFSSGKDFVQFTLLLKYLKQLLTEICNTPLESPADCVSWEREVNQGTQPTGRNKEINYLNSNCHVTA